MSALRNPTPAQQAYAEDCLEARAMRKSGSGIGEIANWFGWTANEVRRVVGDIKVHKQWVGIPKPGPLCQPVERRCLNCARQFVADGRYNRLCQSCRHA